MAVGQRTWLYRYGVAVLCAMVAILARWLLDPFLHQDLPLLTLFPAVAVAVWYGGYRPAVLTMLLGYLGANFFFVEPRGQLTFAPAAVIGFCGYLVSCLVIITLGEVMNRAREKAELYARTSAHIASAFRRSVRRSSVLESACRRRHARPTI